MLPFEAVGKCRSAGSLACWKADGYREALHPRAARPGVPPRPLRPAARCEQGGGGVRRADYLGLSTTAVTRPRSVPLPSRRLSRRMAALSARLAALTSMIGQLPISRP